MKISVKKALGTLGSLVVFAIAVIAVVDDPGTASTVLWPVSAYSAALFGIKTAGGVAVQRQPGVTK